MSFPKSITLQGTLLSGRIALQANSIAYKPSSSNPITSQSILNVCIKITMIFNKLNTMSASENT